MFFWGRAVLESTKPRLGSMAPQLVETPVQVAHGDRCYPRSTDVLMSEIFLEQETNALRKKQTTTPTWEKTWAHHGTSWHIIAHHGTSWHIMAHHGTSWHIMAHHGTSWQVNVSAFLLFQRFQMISLLFTVYIYICVYPSGWYDQAGSPYLARG